MHARLRFLIFFVLVAVVLAGLWWLQVGNTAEEGPLTASGTIEARSVRVGAEIAGRVAAVEAEEGGRVAKDDVVVRFDDALLRAQRDQAEANLRTAQGNVEAARSNHVAATAAAEAASAQLAQLQSGAAEQQLEVARIAVEQATNEVDALEGQLGGLAPAVRAGIQGQALERQVDAARLKVASAAAQHDLLAAGASEEELAASRSQARAAQARADAAAGQVAAAEGQVDAAGAALRSVEAQLNRTVVRSPVDGTVLERGVEPGEVTGAGATLLVLGQLDDLTITVYVPEDRYGTVALGDAAELTVDSFPTETFRAVVTYIADEAEFTPRNVQTAQGRRTTVFAIRLAVEGADGQLRPGMPADVAFHE
jgi:multidrug resistance efflux pump